MKKLSIDEIEDFLCMIDLKCPEDMYEELSEFQGDCEKFDNCFECWYHTVCSFLNEYLLKSMNDIESEDK